MTVRVAPVKSCVLGANHPGLLSNDSSHVGPIGAASTCIEAAAEQVDTTDTNLSFISSALSFANKHNTACEDEDNTHAGLGHSSE